ncbi:MAG: hypothetical protein KDA42_18850 [Planctomycetales bacterium]|nr:hypothetical protein [Planctomycetales bacterium]
MLVAIMVALLGTVTAGLSFVYLPLHGGRGRLLLAILASTLAAAALLYWIVRRLARRRWGRLGIVVSLGALLIAPPISMVTPGRFTYARFGLSVYGLIPVPVFDITIDRQGLLWFREKSHLATADEIAPLLDESVEVLILGTGWHERMRLDDSVRDLKVKTIVLPTPQAFQRYNQLRSEGVRVVLLAHSTC